MAARAAVELAKRVDPQIVLMDINMPKMNGIEATALIKASSPSTIVIGLSVNADENNVEAMKRAGAETLITKESAVDDVYSTMRTIRAYAASRRRHSPNGGESL